MKFDDPKLREILAGAYVMGTLPRRARARFERLMADDEALARLVAEWSERLAPIDTTARPVKPPERVWRAVDAATGGAPRTLGVAPARPGAFAGWWMSLALWRGVAIASLVLLLANLFPLRLIPPIAPPAVVAVLSDQSGAPAWLVTRGAAVEVAPIRPQPLAAGRSFELWAIAGGPPRALGVFDAATQRLALQASDLPRDGVLAVSLEPAGGSPTGAPTGPVLYQGKILPPAS